MKDLIKQFNKLSLSQKITLTMLIFVAIITPIAAVSTLLPTNIRSKAAEPVSNPLTPTPTPYTSIKLYQPNGGEYLTLKTYYPIMWSTTELFHDITINIIPRNGSAIEIAKNLPDIGKYDWSVDNSFAPTATDFRINIIGHIIKNNILYTYADISDSYFSIGAVLPTNTPTPTKIPITPPRYLGPPVKDY